MRLYVGSTAVRRYLGRAVVMSWPRRNQTVIEEVRLLVLLLSQSPVFSRSKIVFLFKLAIESTEGAETGLGSDVLQYIVGLLQQLAGMLQPQVGYNVVQRGMAVLRQLLVDGIPFHLQSGLKAAGVEVLRQEVVVLGK